MRIPMACPMALLQVGVPENPYLPESVKDGLSR
jgi:hypothetical protein